MANLQIEKSTSYTREDWQKGYESQPNEYSYWIDDIEGEIPTDLNGTFFRNGPGLLDINGQAIAHPFDGDGMVCAIGFKMVVPTSEIALLKRKVMWQKRQQEKFSIEGFWHSKTWWLVS